MSGKRYTEEFKIAAVKQVAQRGHPVSEVAERLGVSIHSLYAWVKRYGVPDDERKAVDADYHACERTDGALNPNGDATDHTCAPGPLDATDHFLL